MNEIDDVSALNREEQINKQRTSCSYDGMVSRANERRWSRERLSEGVIWTEASDTKEPPTSASEHRACRRTRSKDQGLRARTGVAFLSAGCL